MGKPTTLLSEIMKQVLAESHTQKYRWQDGTVLEVDGFGNPVRGVYQGKPIDGEWKSLGYANGWKEAQAAEFNKIKDTKWYTVNQSMHKEAIYAPAVKVWYEVDSSG